MTRRGALLEIVNPEKLDPVLGEASLIDMSWSRLDAYDWCKRKYKYKYCEGLADGWALPLALGKAIHETLESCVRYRVEDETECIGYLMGSLDKNDPDNLMEDQDISEARELALSTFEAIKSTTDYENIIEVELGFGMIVGRGLFIGFLDLVFWDEDEEGMFIRIRDYKTGKKKKKTQDSGQMKLYTAAIKRMFSGYRVKSGLYWVRTDEEDVYEFSDEDLEEFLEEVAAKVEEIIEDDSYQPAKEMFKCSYCAFARDDLCKFGVIQAQRLARYRTKKAANKG